VFRVEPGDAKRIHVKIVAIESRSRIPNLALVPWSTRPPLDKALVQLYCTNRSVQ
jgi:hypothetical protein